jgi:hypothetical protein
VPSSDWFATTEEWYRACQEADKKNADMRRATLDALADAINAIPVALDTYSVRCLNSPAGLFGFSLFADLDASPHVGIGADVFCRLRYRVMLLRQLEQLATASVPVRLLPPPTTTPESLPAEPARTESSEQMDKIAQALALLITLDRKNQHVTVKGLADAVGLDRTTLYRDDVFMAAWRARTSRGNVLKGSKSSDGAIEAEDPNG